MANTERLKTSSQGSWPVRSRKTPEMDLDEVS